MIKRLAKFFTISVLSVTIMPIHAADLVEVFQQALVSDPIFQQASAQRLSQLQNVPIALSSLLPFINGTGELERIYYHEHIVPHKNKNGVRPPTVDQSFQYNIAQYDFNVSQPLFDYQAWSIFQQAKIGVKNADATFAYAVQSLIIRVATAYFNVLNAEDDLRYIQAEKRATYRQLVQVKAQYEVGIVAITDVYQAQAQYDTIFAREIAAKNDIVNRKEDLRKITGVYYDELAGLKTLIPLTKPSPDKVDEWVLKATLYNWNFLAAFYLAQMTREQIDIASAGHLPTIDAFGNYTGVRQSSSSRGGKSYNKASTVGITVDLPIYQGGLIVAQTRKAEYNYKAALQNAENVKRSTMNDTYQSFNNIIAGISKVKADKQAVISNEASFRSTIEGYKVGTQTMLDVLQSQQYLFNAEREYSADQYGYIDSIFALRLASGALSYSDIVEINAWLAPGKESYSEIRAKKLENAFDTPEDQLGNVPDADEVNITTLNGIEDINDIDNQEFNLDTTISPQGTTVPVTPPTAEPPSSSKGTVQQ